MYINDKYTVCDIMDEVFLVPKSWDKKDQSVIKQMVGAAGIIVKFIVADPAMELQILQQKVCEYYEADSEEEKEICAQVEAFVRQSVQEGFILCA